MPRKNSDPNAVLDRQDRAILGILQRDNKTPQRAIAAQVNLSAAAVQRRIAALEQAGVIARNVAIVDAEAVNVRLTAVVEVYLKDERAATVDAMKAAFRGTPEVQQCFYVTGGTSFVLVVVVPDMHSYAGLARRLFEHNDAIEKYRTLVALERVKTDTAIVIP